MVINCHASPGRFISGGETFNQNNTSLFAKWNGLKEKIWLIACNVSQNQVPNTLRDGHLFVSEIAKAANCYVVASPYRQTGRAITYPYGMIDTIEGLTQSYAPDGTLSWQRSDSSPSWYSNRE